MSLLCKKPRLLICTKNIRGYISMVNTKFAPATPAVDVNADMRVDKCDAHRFMVQCLVAVKTPECHAEQQADLLIEADYRGHYSHGMNRIEIYINDITKGSCKADATPKILKESPGTAWVCGQNGLGAVAGNFCIQLAMKKAKESGVGLVVANNTNHYGIAGWYSMQAMKQGLIGFSCTNTSPFMGPTRSKVAGLGTNPLTIAAPANKDSFILDMATTAVAVGKLEMARRKGQPIPPGWAQGPDGKITTDTNLAFKTGVLMPLGGAEENSGYKGYGLGTVVEILCGILGGANYSTKIRKWNAEGAKDAANLGQCFMAINPECFAPGFQDRLEDLLGILRCLTPQDKSKPVLVAGDPEKEHMKKVDKEGGLAYVTNQIEACKKLAERFKLEPLKQFKKKTGKCV